MNDLPRFPLPAASPSTRRAGCCSSRPDSTATELDAVLASIHTRQVDFADLYFQYSRVESWSLEEGIVKSGTFNIDRGVGVRAVHGEKQAFAYSDDITLAGARGGGGGGARDRPPGPVGGRAAARSCGRARTLYAAGRPGGLAARRGEGRAARTAGANGARARPARRAGDGVARRRVRRGAGRAQRRLVAADVRPLVRVSLTVIVEEDGRREQGYAGGGGRFDYAYFTDAVLDDYATQAVAQALLNLARARRRRPAR